MTEPLVLKRVVLSRSSGQWREHDYDVLEDGVIVGRIFKVLIAPGDRPWMWTIGCDHHKHRTPTHGCEPTREEAMAAFAQSWRRE